MADLHRGIRAGLVALFLGIGLLLAVSPASAQSLEDQLARLQRELQDLQAYVYGGGVQPGAGSASTAGGSNLAAQQEVRLQQLESQIAEVNGKLEEALFQIRSLSDRLDLLSKDVDFRLTALEQRMAGGAAAATPGTGATVAGTAGATPDATASGTAPAAGGTQILGTLTQSQLDAAQGGSAGTGATATAPAGGTQTAAVAYDLPGDTPEAQYEYAFGLLKQQNYGEAELALAEFVRRHPDDVLAGNAQYWLGETHYVRADYEKAAVAFAEGFQKYPNSGKAADNLLKLGMSLGELGRTKDACTALNELFKRYPSASDNILQKAQRERQTYSCG